MSKPWLMMAALVACSGDTADQIRSTDQTDSGTPSDRWTVRGHDCPGTNRTDALWVDTDGTVWIGCGSGAEGSGLYMSTDDGASWSIPETSPANVLASYRVLSVHRGYGGLLYVAGTGLNDSMAISLDTTSGAPFAAAAVLTAGSTIDLSFQAGPFVTTPGGRAWADSFTGAGSLFRPNDTIGDDANDWVVADGWEDDGSSHQILDMVVAGEEFVAVGSTIAEPPYVFLPSQGTGEAFELTPMELVSGLGAYSGEMWGVAASVSRVVAVGVDQDNDIGKIFVSGNDAYEAADYTQIDVDPLVTGRPSTGSTWARGACMADDRVVVVGEIHPLGTGGFVLESTDGGHTFTDISPSDDVASWSKCAFAPEGLVIAGAGAVGWLAE